MKKSFFIISLVISMAGLLFPQKIAVTAHRGASGYAPENTLASFSKAIRIGADFSELDAQETSDGVLVIIHDSNYKRTTGEDKNVWETAYDDVRKLDAGFTFGPEFKGEKIPRLAEVINLVYDKTKLNIELKSNGHYKKLAEKVVELITQMDFIDRCVITSFEYPLIQKVKELNPKIKTGLIFSKMPDFDLYTSNIDIFSTHMGLVNNEFVEKAHKAGKEVFVWTVNKEEDMKKYAGMKVDNIVTNYPDILKKVLNNK